MLSFFSLLSNREPEGVPSTTIREIGLLRELNHPNLIELLGVSKCEDNLYLVFEYLDQDLRQLLDDETINMSESVVKSYLWQMLQAIAHCHTKRILHRDLKPQNLLIDFQGNIKLADLGLARSIDLPIQPYTHEVVTLWYRAPEILLGSTVYGPPVDIWAIGCIFAEMCTRKVLFLGDSEIDQIFRIFRTLGTPTDEIWPGVTDLPDFQRTFPSWKLRDLGEILPELKKDPLDLLKVRQELDPSLNPDTFFFISS